MSRTIEDQNAGARAEAQWAKERREGPQRRYEALQLIATVREELEMQQDRMDTFLARKLREALERLEE